MKNHYTLLGVQATAAADDIKRAFRREIARYHPDKVQHLGPEFQEIAATRAAELTEAYRILMDEEARRRYDEGLTEAADAAPSPPQGASAAPAPPEVARHAPSAPPPGETPAEPAVDRRFQHERATTSDFVRKAVFAKLRDAVSAVCDAAVSTAPGLDAVYSVKAKGGLFRKSEPALRLLAKYVPHVDAAAIAASWQSAVAGATRGNETVCLLLLGGGMAPARELAAAIAEQRRKNRKAPPVLVPVDVRDWEALFPPEAPALVRAIIQRLRQGDA